MRVREVIEHIEDVRDISKSLETAIKNSKNESIVEIHIALAEDIAEKLDAMIEMYGMMNANW